MQRRLGNIGSNRTVPSQKYYFSSLLIYTFFFTLEHLFDRSAVFNQEQVFSVNSYSVGSVFYILAVHKIGYLTTSEILG